MILFRQINKKYITQGLVSLFYTNLELRPSCHDCPFSYQNRYSDITIGDYWGIQEEHPGFDVKAGVSAVIINSKKGKELFNAIQEDLYFEESTVEKIIKRNPNLVQPTPEPENRAEFWDYYDHNGLGASLEKYVSEEDRKIVTLKEWRDAHGIPSSIWKRIKNKLRIRTQARRILAILKRSSIFCTPR